MSESSHKKVEELNHKITKEGMKSGRLFGLLKSEMATPLTMEPTNQEIERFLSRYRVPQELSERISNHFIHNFLPDEKLLQKKNLQQERRRLLELSQVANQISSRSLSLTLPLMASPCFFGMLLQSQAASCHDAKKQNKPWGRSHTPQNLGDIHENTRCDVRNPTAELRMAHGRPEQGTLHDPETLQRVPLARPAGRPGSLNQ